MMFFFKPKEIHLDCFTSRPEVYKFSSVDYSHKFYPEWWLKLPKTYQAMIAPGKISETPTMKGCIGFINYYKHGITMPLWSDLRLTYLPDQREFDVNFSYKKCTYTKHHIEQMSGLINPDEFSHVKLISPWIFKTKEDIQWVWSQNTWNFSPINKIIMPPAIIDFKYQHGTNINFFISKKIRECLIPNNQPLVNIIPLSERKVEIHTHLVDDREMEILSNNSFPTYFKNKYRKTKELMIKQEKEQKKCPFGFGK